MLSEKRQFLLHYSTFIDTIRKFFSDRDVLEVHTPILGETTIPDPAIESFTASDGDRHYYLQTSPEFYMKRLLAAGSGCIYQLGKVFRREEIGRIHQPEFTMLEWYRIGYDDAALMREVDALVQTVLATEPALRMRYHDAFQEVLSIDIDTIDSAELIRLANDKTHAEVRSDWTFDEILDLLFCECIEPYLKEFTQPVFICEFPESKAALARIVERGGRRVAARFELFYKGIELANGFYELDDPAIQRQRFIKDNEIRLKNNQSPIDLDEKFLQSLSELPECSGVALGIDRLIMFAMKYDTLHDVLNFSLAPV